MVDRIMWVFVISLLIFFAMFMLMLPYPKEIDFYIWMPIVSTLLGFLIYSMIFIRTELVPNDITGTIIKKFSKFCVADKGYGSYYNQYLLIVDENNERHTVKVSLKHYCIFREGNKVHLILGKRGIEEFEILDVGDANKDISSLNQ